MFTVQLPPASNPLAVNKYIISYTSIGLPLMHTNKENPVCECGFLDNSSLIYFERKIYVANVSSATETVYLKRLILM